MADKLKFCYPVASYMTITQRFWASHSGLDFGWNGSVSGGNNQGIVAIADGVVVSAVDGWGNTYPSNRVYGNLVIVQHAGGWYSLYAHMLLGIKVKSGQSVKQGQVVGYMGNTGYSNGQHLHFELRKGGNTKAYSVDPMNWLYIMPSIHNLIVSKHSLLQERIKYDAPAKPIGSPVKLDPSKDQIKITSDIVNGRYYPKLDGRRWGYVTKGVYNIHDRVESGGYTWYMLEPNLNGIGDALWVAYSDKWAVLRLRESGSTTLEAEIKQLQSQVESLTVQVVVYAGVVEAVKSAVGSVK